MALRCLTLKGTKREARLGRTSAAGVQVRGSAEVSLWQEEWSHQRPQVEQQPGPAGANLHPHGCPCADHLPGLSRSETQHPQEPGFSSALVGFNPVLILFFVEEDFLGHIQQYSRCFPSSLLRDHSWQGLGTICGAGY